MKVFVFLVLLGIALASPKLGKKTNEKEEKHYKEVQYEAKPKVSYNKQYQYHGKYDGKCEKDGFYFKDDTSFVICSNNNAYVQPCAPGSHNSAYKNYENGAGYYYRDFCDINLVDQGYGVQHGYNNKVHYEKPKHQVSYSKQYQYHGKYEGKCGKDGFYFNDDASFVICSNNNAYVQPCAPGTRNSGYNHFHYGASYYYRDFCDVNLVDHGYGVHYGGYEKPRYYQPEETYYGQEDSDGKKDNYGRQESYGYKKEVSYQRGGDYGRHDGYQAPYVPGHLARPHGFFGGYKRQAVY